MGKMYVEYRGVFVSLTVAIAFIGTYSAVAALEQFRIAVTSGNGLARHKLLWLVSFCLGGVCIWGEFYLATASYRLHGPTGVELKVYDMILCITSVPVAIVLTHIGLLIASTDPYFTRSKKDILNIYRSSHRGTMTTDQLKRVHHYVPYIHRPARIIIGGLFLAAAIILMRYMGLTSIHVAGTVLISPGITVLHAILVVFGSVVGFWLYFRVLSMYPSWDSMRTACAVHGMLLFAGLKYVGMAGVKFDFDANKPLPNDDASMTSTQLFAGAIIGTVMTAFLVLVFVLADMRTWLQKTNTQLRQADRALLALLHRPTVERNLSHHHYTGDGEGGDKAGTGAYSKGPQLQRHSLFTQPPRHSQAPLEVVNYSRQFLKSVAQRTSTQGEIFTHQYRLFYDIDPERFGLPDGVVIPRNGAPEISREGSRLSGIAEHQPQRASTQKPDTTLDGSAGAGDRADAVGEDEENRVQMVADNVRVKPRPASGSGRTERDLEVSTTLRRVIVDTMEEDDG